MMAASALVVAAPALADGPVEVEFQEPAAADYASFATFGIGMMSTDPDEHDPVEGPYSAYIAEQLQEAMEDHGLTDAAEPDVLVTFVTALQSEDNVHTFNMRTQSRDYRVTRQGGVNNVMETHVGYLTVLLVDPTSGQVLWRADARADVEFVDPNEGRSKIGRAHV